MPELTVASTTDTQKAINAAAGAEQQEEERDVVVAEPEAAEPEEKPEPKPSKSASQKRFDAMTRRIRELEAQVSSKREPEPEPIREEVQEQQAAPRPKASDLDAAGKPKYASYEEYEEALMDWKIDQRQAAEAQRAAEQQAAAQQQRVNEAYNAQVVAAKAKYDDWDSVLANAPQIYTGVGQVLKELDNGAEVVYYLSTHRDVAQKLLDMGPLRAMAEVGRIASQLGTLVEEPEEVEEADEEISQDPTPAPRKAISAAPKPLPKVGGSATKSSVPLDELPYSEYRKIRDQQSKNRYRR